MLGVMEMYEVGRLQISDRLSKHLPETSGSNKGNLVLSDIMTHHAVLLSWIPFYEETIGYSIYNKTYNTTCTEQYCVPVAKNMYMDAAHQEKMWQTIYNSPLPNVGEYKYSDLGYYLLKKILEEKYAHKPLNEYLENRYYKPLGLSTLCFKPTERFSTYSITPSENDTKWRKQVVHGHVHDMGAAMMGGVAGHAGLFSNANDLGVVMQMLLNGGLFEGKRLLSRKTIELMTSNHLPGNQDMVTLGSEGSFSEIRYKGVGFGLGFGVNIDLADTQNSGSVGSFNWGGAASTFFWVDPQEELICILMTQLMPSGYYPIRVQMQSMVYSAFID